MNKTILSAILFVTLCNTITAQRATTFSDNIHTLQTIVDGNPLLPPIIHLGKSNHIEISFDDFSHEYHRYIYKIEHCNADWTTNTQLFESDYLNGFNDQTIDDFETSFNTTFLYTHYTLRIPNKYQSLRLSGNYKVTIFDDDGDEPQPVAQAFFMLVEQSVSINAAISTDTDIDFNKKHQQLTLSINFSALKVNDARRELTTVILQNRRWDNSVYNPMPNILTNKTIEFTHNRTLIFPAGNEYHKFEILNVHYPTLNVDRMQWFDPYYHATLIDHQPAKNYIYDEDRNGAFIIRNDDNVDVDITSDYIFTHFTLRTPQLPGGDVYINGHWTQNQLTPPYKMTYNPQRQAYETVQLLKQGYYNFNYLFVPTDQQTGYTQRTDGDFFQTENEYIILVYHRPRGGRYDKLAGYRIMTYSPANQ